MREKEYDIWISQEMEWENLQERVIMFLSDEDGKTNFTVENIHQSFKMSQTEIEYFDNILIDRDQFTVNIQILHWFPDQKDFKIFTNTYFRHITQVLLIN